MNSNEVNYNTDNLSVEEMENRAVKKSKDAKVAAAVAGAAVVGTGAAGYAAYEMLKDDASSHSSSNAELADSDELTTDSIGTIAEAGAQPYILNPEQAVSQDGTQGGVNVSGVHITHATTSYDENGNTVTVAEGTTKDGHHVRMVDADGDGKADYMAVDTNDDGTYSSDELVYLSGKQQVDLSGYESIAVIEPGQGSDIDPYNAGGTENNMAQNDIDPYNPTPNESGQPSMAQVTPSDVIDYNPDGSDVVQLEPYPQDDSSVTPFDPAEGDTAMEDGYGYDEPGYSPYDTPVDVAQSDDMPSDVDAFDGVLG